MKKRPKFVFYVFAFLILDATTLSILVWYTPADNQTKWMFSVLFGVIALLMSTIMWLSRDILFRPKRDRNKIAILSMDELRSVHSEYPYHIKPNDQP